MKRIGGLVLVAACMGVLSSCVSLQGLGVRSHGVGTGGSHDFSDVKDGGDSAVSGVADVTATGERGVETVGGETFGSNGVLPPLGMFDRTRPGFKVFDPCVEIPEEIFIQLGMERNSQPEVESGYRSCHFSKTSSTESVADVSLVSQHEPMKIIREIYPEEFDGTGGSKGPIYTVEDTFIKGVTCTSYVETVRGLFSVSWTEVNSQVSMEYRCNQSRKVLLELLKNEDSGK